MAGKVVLSTLNDSSGVLATQNGMTGIAKAWARFTVSGTTPTINDSFNMSSITRTATGQYTFNLTTSMPNTNYSVVAGNTIDTTAGAFLDGIPFAITASPFFATPNTSNFTVGYVASVNGTRYEPAISSVAVFSS